MKYKLLAAVVGLWMMLPFRGAAQTFLSAWGPETNGLSARLVLVLPKGSQTIPAFDVVLTDKDLDTGLRILEEMKAGPEPAGARAGVPAAHDP